VQEERHSLTYKDKHIRVTSDLSAQTLKARKTWTNIIQDLRENNCQPRILYLAKLFFSLNGEIRTVHKERLKQFMSTKSALEKVLKGVMHMEEDENNHKHERSGKHKTPKGS
jgi:hypothetical protein